MEPSKDEKSSVGMFFVPALTIAFFPRVLLSRLQVYSL